MNDYKELIGDIGDCLIAHPSETVCKRILREAANAIEQLVKDRNASVDALKALVENIDALPTRNGHWLLKFHDEETEEAIRIIIALCVEKPDTWLQSSLSIEKQIEAWNRRVENGNG